MGDTAAEPAKKKLCRQFDDGPVLKSRPVLIRVGEAKEEYHIHENLLRSNSEFFDNAFKKDWKEGQDRIVDMPETDDEAFNIWVKWLYTGRIHLTKANNVTTDSEDTHKEKLSWLQCYQLGDFLLDADFKDACIDLRLDIAMRHGKMSYSLPEVIYTNSKTASAHRRLAVDLFVHCLERKGKWMFVVEQPPEFLQDVLLSIAPQLETGIKRGQGFNFFDLKDTCKYHDHGADGPCYKTKPGFRF